MKKYNYWCKNYNTDVVAFHVSVGTKFQGVTFKLSFDNAYFGRDFNLLEIQILFFKMFVMFYK